MNTGFIKSIPQVPYSVIGRLESCVMPISMSKNDDFSLRCVQQLKPLN